MKRRQRVPRQWLVADARLADALWEAVARLPRGSGVLLLYRELPRRARARLAARLRHAARRQALVVADELAGEAGRIHNLRELRRSAGVPLLFVSPLFPTASHPDRAPMPRMRAAALARLARTPVIALGGMDQARFRRIRGLGFAGWAGIDAWATPRSSLKSRDERSVPGS